MDTIQVGQHTYSVVAAVESDVPALVALLVDDPLGATRESGDLAPYVEAFGELNDDPNQLLVVVRDGAGNVVGTMQLSLIPGLARGGTKRLQIEAVRLASPTRGAGLGQALLEWAHEWGRSHGASMAQLTSDKQRVDAHRFYARAGYSASHVGFKRML